jgi:hypothetical protein
MFDARQLVASNVSQGSDQSTMDMQLTSHQSRNARSVASASNSHQRSTAFRRSSRARNFR